MFSPSILTVLQGPDGLTGRFYQTAWHNISEYIQSIVIAFFQGANLSRFFCQTCLIMLPKVESPQHF